MKILAASLISFVLASSCVQAQPAPNLDDLQNLTDDLSRGQLFELVKAADAAQDPNFTNETTEWFNLWGPFRFPNDAEFDVVEGKKRENSIFGIDISHHNKAGIPFAQLRQKRVRFVFAKASQGTGFKDGKFAEYWKSLVDTKIHRGAYHFLSAGVDGASQAKTFLRVLEANGGLKETDLPPVMDLEWDKASSSSPDRWHGRSADEIITTALAWLQTVEQATKRKPIIYTARAWVREQPGLEAAFDRLAGYPVWTADYSKTSRANETPKYPGKGYALWQFTDAAELTVGYAGRFDANIFKGSESEFLKAFELKSF